MDKIQQSEGAEGVAVQAGSNTEDTVTTKTKTNRSVFKAGTSYSHRTGEEVPATKIFGGLMNAPEPSWDKRGRSDVTVRALPTVMRMGAQMELHSHLAINLFRGRRGDPQRKLRGIIGLARFASEIAHVWSAAEKDDPFADQCLIEVETKYNEAQKVLNEREKTLSDVVTGLEGLTVGIQTSISPAAIDLQFYCPWAFRASLLLVQFDRIVRLGLTVRHLGLLGDAEWDAIVSDTGRVLRHIFSLPHRWINTGVTREDCRKKTKVLKRALGLYAEAKVPRIVLSDEVLRGEQRAVLSPANKTLEKYLSVKLAEKLS